MLPASSSATTAGSLDDLLGEEAGSFRLPKLPTALSLTLCNILYTLIAVTSIAAFGDGLQDDALGLWMGRGECECGWKVCGD